MAVYSVDSEAVLAAESAARATGERIRADVAAMQSQLQSLQGAWSGQASAAFQQTFEEWRLAQRGMEEALDQINRGLNASARSYADTENAVSAMFR